MSEYLTGHRDMLPFSLMQLSQLFANYPGAALSGSFGRQAMYESFGWPTTPLDVRRPDGSYRDWDIVEPFSQYMHGSLTHMVGRHPIDGKLQKNLAYGALAPGLIYRYLEGNRQAEKLFPCDPSILALRVRRLGGVPVRTLLIGTQQRLEHYIGGIGGGHDEPKYTASRREFDTFAETMRLDHPEEFPQEELFAPFDEARRVIESSFITPESRN